MAPFGAAVPEGDSKEAAQQGMMAPNQADILQMLLAAQAQQQPQQQAGPQPTASAQIAGDQPDTDVTSNPSTTSGGDQDPSQAVSKDPIDAVLST
jgi:hypothetical protein